MIIAALLPALLAASFKVAVHDGIFHADEALAVGILSLHPQFAEKVDLYRTRKPEDLATMDMLIDVGAQYDLATMRFDHHQPTFTDTFSDAFATRLSSAGLIYKHYGKGVIAAKLEAEVDSPIVEGVYQRHYKNFIEPFDAHDNGIARYASNAVPIARYSSNLVPLYAKPYDIFDMVSDLNPSWGAKPEQQMAQFHEAVKLTTNAFLTNLNKAIDYERQRQVFLIAMDRASRSDTPRVLVLSQPCSQWQPLYDLEAETSIQGFALFVIIEGQDQWKVHAVEIAPKTFKQRRYLPAAWRGKNGAELDAVVGIEGCIFVHRDGFVGAHKTLDGALYMATTAVTTD